LRNEVLLRLSYAIFTFFIFTMPRILLLTAGFGEGHNTAARCIAEALREQPDMECRIADVYQETIPRCTKILQSAYGLAINKFPFIWGAIFTLLDKPGMLEKTLPLAGNLRSALGHILEEYHPDVIVSTYPLYAYLIQQLRKRGCSPASVPFITMVTDSTAINSSWYRAGSEYFLLPDEETAEVLRRGGADPSTLQVMGFPVTPRMASLTPLPPLLPEGQRLLYLPSSRLLHTLEVIRELKKIPQTTITVVTGRLEKLHHGIATSGVMDGVQTHLVGWTDKIPELLCTHHLYIGKAGGAIVHEAMAACCPILVSHVVPGQEEGNIELIERHDFGRLAAHYPATLAASVREVFAHQGVTWKRWKNNLERIACPRASRDIASFILKIAKESLMKLG
jgi:processive 1,2-diacylglycerol beta-glucosyltransferase